MIEICLPVYRRYYRLPKIIKDLNAQTNQDFNLNIWNNSGRDLSIFVKDFPKDRLQIIDSETNIGSKGRFKLVPKTKGDPIIFIDDDETFSENFVEYFNQEYKTKKNCILGWYTRTFSSEQYHPCLDKRPYGMEVDYVGTGGMVVGRKIFDKEKSLQDIPEPFDKTEDLYLCYIARMKYNMKLVQIMPGAVGIQVDGKDQYVKINKNSVFHELRKKGWWVLKDNMLKKFAINNLREVQKVFQDLKVPFWIQEGLLLGLWREKDIIKGDEDDVDICVWDKYADKLDKVVEALKEKKFKILGIWKPAGKIEGVAVGKNGNKVDIIVMHKKDKEAFWLGKNWGKIGSLPYFAAVFSADIYDKFREIKWEDLKLQAPFKVDKYLTERYGNWAIPKKRGVDYNPYSLENNPCFKGDFKYEPIETFTNPPSS